MPAPVRVRAQNRLIATLPSASRGSLLDHCVQVELVFAEVLVQADEVCRYVYFPIDGFISVVAAMDDHAQLEVGIIGDEGMLGASLILGVNVSPLHAVVQGAGPALRMSAASFRRELERSAALRLSVHRYIYVQMSQLAQAAICIRYHVVPARLARWLLMTRDRAHSNHFFLTHEFLAYMLGVRRAGITTAAKSLESSGVIDYERGKIVILDERALEAAACPCYRRGNEVYQEILAPRLGAAQVR